MSEGKSPELQEILREVITGKLEEVDRTIDQRLSRIQIPYYIVMALSFAFGILFPFFMSQTAFPVYLIVPVIPFGIFFYFRSLAIRARADLQKEVNKTDSSESEITRIIDKYSGIVDAIGTALPLIGAAILLGIVGSGIKGDKFDQYFTGFAVPFEVISIAILASAKLFESVFDELSLHYQEVIDASKSREAIYYHDKEIEAIKEIRGKDLTNEIPALPKVTKEEHEQMRKTYEVIGKIVEGMKDEKVSQALESLLLLTSKDKNNSK